MTRVTRRRCHRSFGVRGDAALRGALLGGPRAMRELGLYALGGHQHQSLGRVGGSGNADSCRPGNKGRGPCWLVGRS